MVSVIVACRGRSALLDDCLDQLERQTYRDFDVYVVSDELLTLDRPNVRTLRAGPAFPNRKRQIAAAVSTAEIVAFIDDDAYPDPGWLAAAVPHFADPSVVAAGGPGVTPPGDGPRERAGGAVFASPLVTAGVRHRYVAEPARDVAALAGCNLLMRRVAFLRDVEASAHYSPGEEIASCVFATRDGSRIVYDPAVLVFHHRRALFAAHARQVWSYGRFRGFFLRRYRRSWRDAAFAVPAAFVLAHAVVAAALLGPRSRRPALLALGAYAALVGASALREARAARANPGLVALGIYLTHVVYGAGCIAGWLRPDVARDP